MNKIIITVVGKDTVGIIAKVCAYLAENQVNILDISQTILQGAFTMVMAVDVSQSTASFGELGKGLNDLGAELGLSIRIQREEFQCHAQHIRRLFNDQACTFRYFGNN